jgi:hypothetical protein
VFLDADDVLEPRFLEALGALGAARPDLDILTTDCLLERVDAPTIRFYDANDFPVTDQRAGILRSCFITTKTAVRRERYLAVGGCQEGMGQGEDWDVWARLIMSGSAVGLGDAPRARYRLHAAQLTARRGESLWGRVHTLEGLRASELATADDRAVIDDVLPRLRARAAVAAATEQRGLRARRSWMAVAADEQLPSALRLRGLVGTMAPALAARRPAP